MITAIEDEPEFIFCSSQVQIKTAKQRVVMASLYLGTGLLEQELVSVGRDWEGVKMNAERKCLPLQKHLHTFSPLLESFLTVPGCVCVVVLGMEKGGVGSFF